MILYLQHFKTFVSHSDIIHSTYLLAKLSETSLYRISKENSPQRRLRTQFKKFSKELCCRFHGVLLYFWYIYGNQIIYIFYTPVGRSHPSACRRFPQSEIIHLGEAHFKDFVSSILNPFFSPHLFRRHGARARNNIIIRWLGE